MTQDRAGHGEKMSRRKEQAIAALLECQTVSQAAERVGVSEHTLRNWMKRPEFRDAFAAARREFLDNALSRLEKGFEFAVAILQKIAGDNGAPTYARVSAAKGLIDSSFRAAELQELMHRLTRIEERVHDRSNEDARRSA